MAHEISLEDKYQAEFDQMWANNELDKNSKYYMFYWINSLKDAIHLIGSKLTEEQQRQVNEKKPIILEYSTKRQKWELSSMKNIG